MEQLLRNVNNYAKYYFSHQFITVKNSTFHIGYMSLFSTLVVREFNNEISIFIEINKTKE